MKITRLTIKIIIFSIFLLLINIKNISYAQPIKTFPKVEVPNKNSEASNKYAVIANFVKGKTEVKTFGNVKWEHIVFSGVPCLNLTNPPESQKGKFGIIYTNVGTYEGKQLDLKITINNWDKYSKKNASISYVLNTIGHLQGGFNWVDQTWQYVDHETGKPAHISGSYMTFNDLDGLQYIQFSRETTKNIDKMYVSNNTWVDGSNQNGEFRISEVNDKVSKDEDKFAMVTALFSGNEIQFKWGKEYPSNNYTPEKSWDTGLYYFGFIGEKPVRTEVLRPTKLIDDKDEKQVKQNTIQTKNEIFSYDISHTVPNEWKEFFYKSYKFVDDVPSVLEIVGEPSIINEAGKNVSEKFENISSNNHIEYRAKNSTLSKSDFYGHTYHMKIKVRIKSNTDVEKNLDNDGYYHVRNIANIEKDNRTMSTNEVITKYKPFKKMLHKSIIDNNQEVEEKKVRVDESYKYRIKGVVGNNETINDFAIIDDGEDVLSFESAKVFDANHEEITNQGKLTIDKDKNLIKWVPNDISNIYGKTYIMEIDSRIKQNTDLKAYKHDERYIIPNTAQFKINDNVVNSNTVNVYNIPINNSLHKSIIDNNHEIEEKKVRVDELYKYRIRGIVGNSETIHAFAIVDNGEDVLSFENVKVFDANHEEITNQGKLTIDKDKNLIKWVPNDISNIYGKTYIMEIDSRIKQNTDLKAYKHDERYIIPNTAQFKINDNVVNSNTVNVYNIPINNSLHKSIIDNNHEIEEKKVRVDELYKYRIRGIVGNSETIHAFAIVDNGEDVLSFENVKVFDANHEEITNQGKLTIDKEKNIVKWVPNDISNIYGKTYIMEVDSKIKKGAKLKNYKKKNMYIIPNTAQYIINNKVVKSNTVTILTPVKDKSNSININQIQQSIKDNHRLKNSNNKILNSFNDITINIKFINHIIKDLNQDNMSFLDSKVVDKQLKSLLLKKDDKDGRKNRIKNQKNGDENKVKDVQTEELPKTGLTNNLTIVVLGSLLILLSITHVCLLLLRKVR